MSHQGSKKHMQAPCLACMYPFLEETADDLEQASASSSKARAIPIVSYSLGHKDGKVGIKTVPGVPELIAPLKKGPKGFCVADFGRGDGDETTECPNLLLDVVRRPKKRARKKPASAKAKAKKRARKKPASATSEPEEDPESEDEPEEGGESEEDPECVDLEASEEDPEVEAAEVAGEKQDHLFPPHPPPQHPNHTLSMSQCPKGSDIN